jgi:hypothetical protein
MAITFPITLPSTPAVQSVRLAPLSVVATSRSPFTLKTQTHVHQGQQWQLEVQWPTMTRAEAEAFLAALVSLNGKEGSFLFGDPAGAIPRGSAKDTPGTPLVRGASQTGDTINFDGAPSGVTGYLLAGDYVSLGTGSSTRLHKVLEDVNTTGGSPAGLFTLTLWPKVVVVPADNAVLTVSSAQGVFELAENANPWDVDSSLVGGAYSLGFAAMSVV